MRFPTLKEIVFSISITAGVSSQVYGARIEYTPIAHPGMRMEDPVVTIETSPKLEHRFKITVHKRDNLTKIARDINQTWRLYHQVTPQEIYEQNKDKIKNPNLIYPNQEFKLSFIASRYSRGYRGEIF